MTTFHKNKLTKDGLNSFCKGCMKKFYLNKSVELIQKQKESYLKNHNRIKRYKNEIGEKINEYKKYEVKETSRY